MAFTTLPPSTTDRTVIFTVPKEIDPYLVAWFQATKLTGETPATFCLRILMREAKEWYADKQVSDVRATNSTTTQALASEAAVFKAA